MDTLFACLGLCLSLASPSIPPAPPAPAALDLYARLEGDWVAEGTRTYPGSKAYVRIQAATRTEIVTNAQDGIAYAVSRNELTEQPYDAAGAPEAERRYSRVYWIRERAGEPGAFDLGAGADPATASASSRGLWDGSRFLVKQDFGGQPPYTIDSETDLSQPGESHYLEKFWHGQKQLAETAIRYLHASGP